MAATPKPLIPVDRERCQVEKPNGNTFLTMGGVVGLVRCTEKAMFIASEREPGADGRKGAMSLCTDCLHVFLKQVPNANITLESLK